MTDRRDPPQWRPPARRQLNALAPPGTPHGSWKFLAILVRVNVDRDYPEAQAPIRAALERLGCVVIRTEFSHKAIRLVTFDGRGKR